MYQQGFIDDSAFLTHISWCHNDRQTNMWPYDMSRLLREWANIEADLVVMPLLIPYDTLWYHQMAVPRWLVLPWHAIPYHHLSLLSMKGNTNQTKEVIDRGYLRMTALIHQLNTLNVATSALAHVWVYHSFLALWRWWCLINWCGLLGVTVSIASPRITTRVCQWWAAPTPTPTRLSSHLWHHLHVCTIIITISSFRYLFDYTNVFRIWI